MKRTLIVLLILCSAAHGVQAQGMKDSVEVLYRNYFELMETQQQVDSVRLVLIDLQKQYRDFNSLISSNNAEIRKLTEKELFSLQVRLNSRRKKIINTSEFINAANVSLNAIKLLDAISDYSNEISALNNPENEDLGFSITSAIELTLKEKIIKDNNKVNGVKSGKLLEIVNNIISSPLTGALTNSVPVVGSIKSVVELVMGTAVRGDDVSLDDIAEFKAALRDYMEHYEGLARAQIDFSQNLGSVDVRKEALKLLLSKYTLERIATLNPTTVSTADTASLTKIITKYYTKDDVQQQVDLIISQSPKQYESLLADSRLQYPDYAISQAKFIRDEIEALGKEYIATYKSYQKAIEKVLKKSEKIGDRSKIEAKVLSLKKKLAAVESAFNDSVNLENVNKNFQKLIEY